MRTIKTASFLVLFFAANVVQAQGILFVQQETRDGKTSTNQIQIDKTHMRAESRASGESNAFLFDSTTQVARMVNLDKKTYVEITKAQMEQMSGQMNSAMAQMQEQMKNMPPEQRAMVEQMMRGRGGAMRGMAAAAPPTQYKAAGSDKVLQWSCAKYEGFRGNEKVSEVCTVDPKEFGLTAADFEVAKQLAEFMKSLIPQGADQMFTLGTPEGQGFSGIPVRQTSFTNGKPASVREIKEFRRETFPASTFEVPAGFTKQAMGMRQ
jgi:hypothetical protein